MNEAHDVKRSRSCQVTKQTIKHGTFPSFFIGFGPTLPKVCLFSEHRS